MTRDELIEATASRMWRQEYTLRTGFIASDFSNCENPNHYYNLAGAALSAIEAAGVALVPVEPTPAQVDDMASNIRGAGYSGDSYLLARVVWNAARRASPLAKTKP